MGKYDEKDAAGDTGSSSGKVSQAWHDARNDAAASGRLEQRNINKVSDSPEGKKLYSVFKKAGVVGTKKSNPPTYSGG